MNLGQLKVALSRFPADMDNTEVILIHGKNGQLDYGNLAAVGVPSILMAPDDSDPANIVALMTDTGVLIYAKNGKALRANGTKYTEKELLDSRVG